jgi:hypothetical protein
MRMISRCSHKHPTNKYIQKGITVSDEWKTFENFFADMAATFSKELTLERIDNTKGYSKENCRWASRYEQAQNRSTTVRLNYEGKDFSLVKLAEKYGIPYKNFYHRLKINKWPIKKSLETPILTKSEVGKLSLESPNHIDNKTLKRSKARINNRLKKQ